MALAHLEEWAEKFQEENPDVTFNFEEMGVDQVYQKMTTCLQSGIGLPDIVSIEGEQMAKFGEKFPGKFEDFTDMIIHTCYNGVNKGKQSCEAEQISKITSQFGL